MDDRLRQTVRERADHRCEYCCLPQNAEPFFAYHVEHIVARQHGGRDDSENLALACYHCNAHKGPNLSGLDPESGALVRLFHPRQDRWDEHFERNGVLICRSQCGWPSDGWLVEDERRRSASASRTVAFLRGKDIEDLQLFFRLFLLALYCGVGSKADFSISHTSITAIDTGLRRQSSPNRAQIACRWFSHGSSSNCAGIAC